MIPLLFQRPRHLLHRRPYPHVKIRDLIKEERLKQLHLPLNIPQLPPIYLSNYPLTRIIYRLHTLLLDREYRPPHLQLELLQLPLVHYLPLNLQLRAPRPQEIEQLLVYLRARVHEVELVRLVRRPRALPTDPLLVVEAEELELLVRVEPAGHLRDLQQVSFVVTRCG